MRLKNYLQQMSPIFSSPAYARRLLRLFSLLLAIGVLSGVYNFLLYTFNDDISKRRGYMSRAIAEAHAFFTTRGALLEALSLSTVRASDQVAPLDYISNEDVHLKLGPPQSKVWSLWLTLRMREYLRERHSSLLYVAAGPNQEVSWLFESTQRTASVSPWVLEQLRALEEQEITGTSELWLAEPTGQRTHLYAFIRLDDRDPQSGWLGLEMNSKDVSNTLSDQSAGEFMLFNSQGMLVFANSQEARPTPMRLIDPQRENFFGFVGRGLLPDHLVIRKRLKSSDWQLVYSIDLLAVIMGLRSQLLGSLAFCLLSMAIILLAMRRVEHRFIVPALNRIQTLIESEAFSRDVIQTAPVALCVLRRIDGRVVLENNLAQQWLGIGKEHEALCAGWISQAFDSQSGYSDYFATADDRHLYLSSIPTRYKGEDVLLCAFSDISARRHVEAALEEARQLADAANEAKTLFLATMSHEIRTPLYGVLGTLELLAGTDLNAQQKDYVYAIEASSTTLLQLISDVLDVSKIEAGQLALELSEFSITELVQEVMQGYSAAAISKGLQFYACVDPQLPERLIGDINRIRQIINNLLSNAVKFTDCGRVVLRVSLADRDDERTCVVWQVSDTGKGIAQEQQPYIFQPFYQTVGNTSVVAGTGLGLPICQRLTGLMNGQLRVVSELGLGSSFTLTLPLEEVSPRESKNLLGRLLAETVYVVSPVRELTQSVCGWLSRWGAYPRIGSPSLACTGQLLLELHPGSIEQPLMSDWTGPVIFASADGRSEPHLEGGCWHANLNHLEAIHQAVCQAQGLWIARSDPLRHKAELEKLGLKVLVAEDNVINQLILRDQLEELGCMVELVKDGQEALQVLKNGNFDVVLTDVNMPTVNGYELARELRRQGCVLPIIGATANAMRGEEELCLAAGMNHCLVKPLALRTLFHCLASYKSTAHETL